MHGAPAIGEQEIAEHRVGCAKRHCLDARPSVRAQIGADMIAADQSGILQPVPGQHEDRRDNYHRVERNYGAFQRSFTVPSTVDPNRINAVFENGLLRLTLAKRPETQPRAIEVKVK